MNKGIRLNLSTFDFVKGIAVIGIILGHMFSHYDFEQDLSLLPFSLPLFVLRNAINPMFFIASGFGLRTNPPAKMLKKTAHELLRPYFYVTLFIAGLFPAVHYLCYRWWPGAVQEMLRYLLAFLLGIPKTGKTVCGISLYECSVMWFFLSLFIALSLLNLILRSKNTAAQLASVIACVLCGYVLIKLDLTYFCLPQGLMAVGYCYVGHLLKKHRVYTGERSFSWLYIALAVVSVLQIFFGDFNLAHGIFQYGLLDYIGAGCAGALLLILGVHIGQREWKGLECFKLIGVYSYWIICIHSVELICIPWYMLSQAMAEHQLAAFLIESCIKGVILASGCFVLKKISRHTYKRRMNRSGK